MAQVAVDVSSTGNRSVAIWPPPAFWHGAYAGFGSTMLYSSDPGRLSSISLTLSTATVAGYWDDVFLTIDPRVACWCDPGYAYDAVVGSCVRCQAGFYCAWLTWRSLATTAGLKEAFCRRFLRWSNSWLPRDTQVLMAYRYRARVRHFHPVALHSAPRAPMASAAQGGRS